jgi:NAD(P)-dependent dehydrogenase (short-subunit alcohol dehydrogenase family)
MGSYVIAGGTKGIGAAITRQLLSEGHTVTILARESSNDPTLQAAEFVAWDARDGALPALTFDRIDGAVYCPGTIRLKPFHRFTVAEYMEDWQINALGAALFLQALHKPLTAHASSSVVLFSTVAVQQGMSFHASIAMAKGAIEGLGRSLAAEWAPHVRVNTIAPSLTQTPLAEKLLASPDKIEAGNKRHPMGRVGQPEDLASLACFLLGPQSSWITGQVIGADGGMSHVRMI